MFFCEVDGLQELETNGLLDEARTKLFELWKRDKTNVYALNRVGCECWYVMAEWDIDKFDFSTLNYDLFKRDLITVTNYGLEHFNNNAYFLSLFGYMISLFSYFFYDEDGINDDINYTQWEKIGLDLLKQSYLKEPENPIIRTFYFGSIDEKRKYKKSRQEAKKIINLEFPGNTLSEKYFKEIFAS